MGEYTVPDTGALFDLEVVGRLSCRSTAGWSRHLVAQGLASNSGWTAFSFNLGLYVSLSRRDECRTGS